MSGENLSVKESYEKNGYYIFRKLIPDDLIAALLGQFQESIAPSNSYFFRQSSNQWEKNVKSPTGYLLSSFLDIHDYEERFAAFSLAAKNIFCSQIMKGALSQITGSESHNLMQSMMFDQNTATPPHQDCYYLDSVPTGHLFGVWFALEDIHEKAGRFYVLPGTNNVEFDLSPEERVANEFYVKRIKRYVDEHAQQIQAPALDRGDILVWSSKTIHGALPTQDGRYSRKSLTAHYIPSQYEFGNMWGKAFEVPYAEFNGMKYRRNEKRYSLSSVAKYKVKNFLQHHPYMRRVVTAVTA